MRYSISNTAEYGDMMSGPRVIDSSVKERMKDVLKDIQTGKFANNWLKENEEGCKSFNALREKEKENLIEKVGTEIRSKIKFPNQQKLVDKTCN